MFSGTVSGGRKRAAVELIAREGDELRRTAARFSLCEEDAEDAYQRALEILLLKAPSERPRDLIRWTKTVVKHEALAIRAHRERLLGEPPPEAEAPVDPLEAVPAEGEDPDERLARRELVARSREALSSLKPAELRALTLLAAGYTYAEIGEITGYSQTKINRCLAEGRERFRRVVAESEAGSRCAELRPLLSPFCDGEAGARDAAAVREHLRACPSCRATVRAYRTAPAALAALGPALPLSRPLAERAQELLVAAQARLPGSGGAADAGAAQIAAAGGSRGAGMAALAKLLAVCAGTAGGAAACVATGVAPLPLERPVEAVVERAAERPASAEETEAEPAAEPVEPTQEPEPAPAAAEPEPAPEPEPEPAPEPEPTPTYSEAESESGAVEYAPEAAPAAQVASAGGSAGGGGAPQGGSSGSAAGEFGP